VGQPIDGIAPGLPGEQPKVCEHAVRQSMEELDVVLCNQCIILTSAVSHRSELGVGQLTQGLTPSALAGSRAWLWACGELMVG
jgi:hypothetical protein